LHESFIITAASAPRLGERIVWVIEGGPLDAQRCQRLLEFVKTRLPKFYAPLEIVTLEAFPETKTGKINRTAIKKLLSDRV